MKILHKLIAAITFIGIQVQIFGEPLFKIAEPASYPSQRGYRYVDSTGAVKIPGPFCLASDFHDGVAVTVKICRNPKNSQSHQNITADFINTSGETIFSRQADLYLDAPMPVLSSGLINLSLNGKCGYVDKTGAEKIPFTFEDCGEFGHRFAYVRRNKKNLFINKVGQIVQPFQFAFDHFLGCAEDICLFRRGEKYFYHNTRTNKKVKGRYKLAGHFSNNLAPVLKSRKWGYINTQGQLVIPYKFEYASSFTEGLGLVRKFNTAIYFFIDLTGRKVHSDYFESAWPFRHGLFFAWRRSDGNCYYNNRFQPVICEKSFQ